MPADKKTPAKGSKHLTAPEWAEACELWRSGSVTLNDLAHRFGKAAETFSRKFKAEGIVKGERVAEMQQQVQATVKKQINDDAAILAKRIRDTKEQHYAMAEGLSKLTWNEITQARQNNQPMAVAQNNLKALQTAAQTLKALREERWAILGLDNPDQITDDELPELVISELTQEQIMELQRREEEALAIQGGHLALDPGIVDTSEIEDDNDVVEEGDD